MNYEEFQNLRLIKDEKNPFCALYVLDTGESFYLEPAFYTQMQGFKERHTTEDYQKIVNAMIEITRRNKRVVFTANFEYPQTDVEDYIYLEITDVTDPLHIFVEDKSRGSDYGD